MHRDPSQIAIEILLGVFTVIFPFRYTFGKKVTGLLAVNLTVKGDGYYEKYNTDPVALTMRVCVNKEPAGCYTCTCMHKKL